MQSLSTRLRFGLIGLGLALAVACVLLPRTGESGRGSEPAAAPRGIVLVCVDTLRADGVSLPGEPEGPMPRLQALARDGTVFADAIGSSAWTEPSVASLLTGLRPLHHGLLPFFGSARLVPSVETVAERLKAAGWSTGAITAGGWVSPDVGLGQGFDRFAVDFDEASPETTLGAWNRARPKDRPFFLFLHTCTAHDPYGNRALKLGKEPHPAGDAPLTPADLVAGLERAGGALPADMVSRFGLQFLTDPRNRYASRQVLGAPRFEALGVDLIPWYEGGYASGGDGAALAASVRDSYRAGLAYVDQVLGEAFDALARQGLLDASDVIVTGDHGECFGEHGALWHGLNVFDEALRVPLILRTRERSAGPRVVRGACDMTDVAATVLDLAGLPSAPGLDGRSLRTLAGAPAPGRTAIAELERNLDQRRPTNGRVRWFVARSTEWKWMLRYDPADATVLGESLFHLTDDPREATPLESASPLPPSVGDEFRRVVETERARLRRLANPASLENGYLAR